MLKTFQLLCKFLFFSLSIFSQLNAKSLDSISVYSTLENDSISKNWVKGQARNYFLATNHQYGNDYYTDALGLHLNYETEIIPNIRVGVAANFVQHIFSSDLDKPFAETTKSSRWEKELYDVRQPTKKNALTRLDQFYIRYQTENSFLQYGKATFPHTVLLNKSDGRMMTFSFQGAWLHHRKDNISIDFGWIHRFSPRSMTNWYSTQNTIGLSDNGYQPNGKPAIYKEKIPSKGLGIAHIQNKTKNFTFDYWQFHLDKVMSTSWLQAEFSKENWLVGGIFSYQIPFSYQNKLAYNERYIQTNEKSKVASFTLAYSKIKYGFQFAYSKAFSGGRFLFPKEMGRDQFYTSMPRSRMDGMSNIDVLSMEFFYRIPTLHFSLKGVSTKGISPEIYTNNKYGLDDYWQLNTKMVWDISRSIKGFQLEFLHVWKINKNENDNMIVEQRSNFQQFNLIANWSF